VSCYSDPHFISKPVDALWLKSEIAALRVIAAGRRIRRLLHERKFNPDQPRVPAGRPGGGRWVSVGGEGADPGDQGPLQEPVANSLVAPPWRSITTLPPGAQPQAQVIAGRDGSITTTEWDTHNVESWAVRQTARDQDRQIITTTEFRRDGSGEIAFGAGSDGKFQLVNDDGRLKLGSEGDATAQATGIVPEPGSRLALLMSGAAVATQAGTPAGAPLGAAAAAIIVGATAFPGSAGGDSIQSLGPDLRFNQRDDGQAPRIESRVGGRWVPVEGATSFAGSGDTIIVDAGRLRAAIGEDGTERAIAALADRGPVTITGERWSPETGREVGLKPRDVEQSCKMYPDFKAAVEWAASAVDREALPPGQYGTAVHVAVDHYFKYNYAAFDPKTGEFNTEFSVRKGTDAAYYGEKGS